MLVRIVNHLPVGREFIVSEHAGLILVYSAEV